MENKKYHIIPEEWLKEQIIKTKPSWIIHTQSIISQGRNTQLKIIQKTFPSEEINKQESKEELIREFINWMMPKSIGRRNNVYVKQFFDRQSPPKPTHI